MWQRCCQVLALLGASLLGVSAIDVEIGRHDAKDPEASQAAIIVTPSGKQLLRREVSSGCSDHPNSDCNDRHKGAAKPVAPNGHFASLALERQRNMEASWQLVSAGDVQAITVHDGDMFAVSYDNKLSILELGIFRQSLSGLTPYSNWVLAGYGSMTSIAVHSSPTGKIMYGVGNNSWLYKQDLVTMATRNTWEVASWFKVSYIAIDGDMIYGISPDNPGQLYQHNLINMISYAGWDEAGSTAEIKSFTIAGGTVFAILENTKLYNKLLGGVGDDDSDSWTLKDEAGMISVAVIGDTMYGVSSDHKVYREPLTINKNWRLVTAGPMRSLAIGPSEDTIYGAGPDGIVYTKDLLALGSNSLWKAVSRSTENFTSLAIDGEWLYATALDKRLYQQNLKLMTNRTAWHLVSACCVNEIVVVDGVVYGVGDDMRVYRQTASLMTLNSSWILAGKGKVITLAVRGDLIYAVGLHGHTYEQRLSSMSNTSEWVLTSFEDAQYPSTKYLSIMAHNDIMYACGENMNIYTKLINTPLVYRTNLVADGNTHRQALRWNLTDLNHPLLVKQATTAAPAGAGEGMRWGWDGPSTPTTTDDLIVPLNKMATYVDRFKDTIHGDAVEQAQGTDQTVGFEKINARAWRSAHVHGLWQAVMYSGMISIALTSLG